MAELYGSTHHAARGLFAKARAECAQKLYPQSITTLNELQKEYPKSSYSRIAEKRIASIKRRMVKEMESVIFD